MATHSSILAWEIPWVEEPEGLQSMGSQSDMTEHTCARTEKVLKMLNEVFPPVITDKLQRATIKLREKDRQ